MGDISWDEFNQNWVIVKGVIGASTAPITPLTITRFQRMGALASTGAYPFDKYREGLVLGEGAAVFVLESGKLARQRKAKIYEQILGAGITADAYHGNVPDPQGRSAIIAVKQCLKNSHLKPEYILNDKALNLIIQYIFSNRVAISSTKGATGNTLGASGALSLAFSLMSLHQKILPPCVGLKVPEFDLNLAPIASEARYRTIIMLGLWFWRTEYRDCFEEVEGLLMKNQYQS